ncbi:efflux transporter outer membrane subunit [Massilia dura]|uniref:Efflux transporter outer membrane subunit n=1 Tax=Pseudoduganella dura TaxID=321982 RepID=A0A6I3XE96_9BURK|nr:efflux transporter outer membrane subunit [Pseudoduganella dura]MUI14747.1 efflux transporter outer membrane subunit [Pseudoduganella dura]GGX98323.1 multidrug ABC transporter permease [Pseudoduganella dura]
MKALNSVGILLCAGMLSACSLAPKYERPAAPVAADFPENPLTAGGKGAPPAAADATSAVDTGWRDFFPDGRLQALIAAALDNNRDLRTAALRIEEARAAYGITRADRLPNLNGTLSGTRARSPGFVNSATGQPAIAERFDAGLSIPAFELDFFGRVRSLSDAALATYLATGEARQAAQISIVAEVAKAYFTERANAEQLALAQRTYEARRRTYELTLQRLDAGASSLLDLRSNETLMETARASALALARQRAQAGNALTLLVGAPVDQETAGAMADDAQIDAMSAVPAGLPSDLIARRPDIRAAEQRLLAANASIGAARAAFFPRISLTAAVGSASPAFSQLFDSGNDTWSFVPQLTLPIFDAGRNRANLDLAGVRKNIAVADYERTIQTAFREVADALAARSYLGDQVAAQRAIQDAQAERLRLLTLRFENGVASTLDVLDAQRELFAAEQELVQARLLRTTSAIDLYRALGGGLR